MIAGLQQAIGGAVRDAQRLSILIVTAASIALTACGEGGGDEQAQAQTPPAQTPPSSPPPAGSSAVPNKVPTISGTPVGSVVVGTAYAFTPTASDGDGDILTFSITGKPGWAAFNTSTGKLSGTPTQADIGSASVTIRVTDGAADAILAAFTIQVVGTATGSATLSWTPPTLNSDGTPLTNLAGYKVYWGTDQNALSSSVTLTNAGLTSYVVDQLTPAKWFFATTAFNTQGVESNRSGVASKTVL